MAKGRTQSALALWARLAYTSFFERVRVIAGSSVGSIPYGALTAIQGASAPVSILLPNATTAAIPPGAGLKEAHSVGILDVDGAQVITITAPDGKLINGASSLVLPASAGAFAICFYDVSVGAWFAITAPTAGGIFTPPPTYTAKGTTPQALTGSFVAIAGASVTTAPFTALQKAIISCSLTMSAAAGTQDNVAMQIFDGVATTQIDGFSQTVGNSAVDDLPGLSTVSWTLEAPGNGLARTFGIAAGEVAPGVVTVNVARTVVAIVDG